jgi:hypothetical protein
MYIWMLAGLLVLLLACKAVTFAGSVTPTSPASIAEVPSTATPFLSERLTLTSVPLAENNPGSPFPKYTITAQTPQLTGSDEPRVLAFNQRLNDLVAAEVDAWRKSFQELPITPVSNGSMLDVKYTLVSQIGELWSFKFDFPFYSDTAAHPGLYSITLNYDLAAGRELLLGDLFVPESAYLEALSEHCKAELQKQPFSDSFFLDGAQPTPVNYRNWNITPDGLLITFDEYQVAPYAAGPQTVVVPYNGLAGLIDLQGPLAVILR